MSRLDYVNPLLYGPGLIVVLGIASGTPEFAFVGAFVLLVWMAMKAATWKAGS